MNIFLRWGIIVKLYPSSNATKFHDNKDLYTLCIDEKETETKKTIKEPVYESISKSANDLVSDSVNRSSFRVNRSVYRSFGKSTYNQIHNTIKKTTSTIIKSTNHNVTKFTNQTLNKLNNKSGSNLIKKLNNFKINSNLGDKLNRSNNSVKKSTSVTFRNVQPIERSSNRSFSQSILDKENRIVDNEKSFKRNYRGYLSTSYNGNNSIRKVNNPSNNKQRNLSTSLNSSVKFNTKNIDNVSLNPMNPVNDIYAVRYTEQEGNNLIRFLTKISDNFARKPLRPQNSTSSSIQSSGSIGSSLNSQIFLNNNNQVNYRPVPKNYPQSTHLPALYQINRNGCYYNTLV